MIGPGVYDNECTEVRLGTEAEGVILLVFGGRVGNGFSVQGPLEFHLRIPALLRAMADQIERDFQKGKL